MTAMTVKNIPDELYEKLRIAAKAHRRSINNELIYRLEQSLQPQHDRAEIVARARELRAGIKEVDPDFIIKAIDRGRDNFDRS